MMYIIYNILGLLVFFVVILPFFLYRLVTENGFSVRFRQSMGLIRREEIANVMNSDCIWIHGASIGESQKQTVISISRWTCLGWQNLLYAVYTLVSSCL